MTNALTTRVTMVSSYLQKVCNQTFRSGMIDVAPINKASEKQPGYNPSDHIDVKKIPLWYENDAKHNRKICGELARSKRTLLAIGFNFRKASQDTSPRMELIREYMSNSTAFDGEVEKKHVGFMKLGSMG